MRWSRWMAEANGGDAVAYQKLMTELGSATEAYLQSRIGVPESLEDCVQECLLAVHRARGSYDPARPFRPWMFTIVRHKAIDWLRHRTVRSVEWVRDEQADPPARPSDPAHGIEGARLLQRLDPAQREALVLTKYAGLTLEEAAERSGVSPSAMKSRVHRALRELRRQLGREGGFE